MIKREDIKKLNIELTEEQRKMEEHFIDSAVVQTELHIERYMINPSSFRGQYINSDLFKETFPEYSISMDAKYQYRSVVHNPAAVLSNELFDRMVKKVGIKRCIFITGIPGAGKSFLIQSLLYEKEIDEDTIIFEGNIGSLDTIKVKIEKALNNNLEVNILVVDCPLELALNNTFKRFYESGRGSLITTMAFVYSAIPFALEHLHSVYGNRIKLGIFIKKNNYDISIFEGWDKIIMLSKVTYERTLQYLTSILERKFKEGTIDDKCYHQAFRRRIATENIDGKSKEECNKTKR